MAEHQHEHNHAQPINRIEEALKKYNLEITDGMATSPIKTRDLTH